MFCHSLKWQNFSVLCGVCYLKSILFNILLDVIFSLGFLALFTKIENHWHLWRRGQLSPRDFFVGGGGC